LVLSLEICFQAARTERLASYTLSLVSKLQAIRAFLLASATATMLGCRGDASLRGLLYEAATVILTRTSADSGLRVWGLKLREKIGFKRAAVAVARKLTVIMHAMLKSGEVFDRSLGLAV